MASNIKINLSGEIKDVNIVDLWQFISTDRIKTKDKLISFESSVIKGRSYAQWIIDECEPIEDGIQLLNFLKKRLDYNVPIWPFLTLPRSNKNEFDKVKKLWQPYYDHYTYSLNSNYVNLPSGDINPDIVFIGEAPGWKEAGDFMVPVYSYGKTSLLFRFLISIIFGPKYWITNISKYALEKNKKMTKTELKDNLELLYKELEILNPKVIICLGGYVYDTLNEYYNRFKIYHPAYIYRQGNNAKMYAENMMEVKHEIGTLL